MTPAFDPKAFLATVPELPGVYQMFDAAGTVLYVGKAKNLKKRLSSYFRAQLPSARIARMVAHIAEVRLSVVRSEEEALILENHLIKTLAPKYNIVFRDDKTYPYVRLSAGPFPGIYYYRGPLKKGERYFGPYPNAIAARESIQIVQKAFRLRTCEDTVFAHRTRPCLLAQIGRCSAPCVGAVSEEAYAVQVRDAMDFLSGKTSQLIARLTDEMAAAAEALQFERAAELRDRIRALHQLRSSQAVDSRRDEDVDVFAVVAERGLVAVSWGCVRGGRHLGHRTVLPKTADLSPEDALVAFLEQHYAAQELPDRILVHPVSVEIAAWFSDAVSDRVPVLGARDETESAWIAMAQQNARVAIAAHLADAGQAQLRAAALAEALALEAAPQGIEAFDISHLQGEATVAACVVWRDGAMQPRLYRRFNIHGITPGDDYAAMQQAVARRYARHAETGEALPDLILIDGGLGQVRAAAAALAELGLGAERLLGVAKGPERRAGEEVLVFADGRTLELPATDPALHLIQQIRDEAHRFAVTGNRAKRAAARASTHLEDLPGIGPKRRRALLAAFGSLAGVRAATVEDIARVPGFSVKLAERLYNQLHGKTAS